jgi:hypothetical protein
MFNVYEIYTVDPITGTTGWDIEFIVAFDREDAATFENFDCVICHDHNLNDVFSALRWDRSSRTDAVNEFIKQSMKAA